MTKPNFGCSQADLFKACRFVWLLCQQYLTELANYKSVYTAAFILENLALVKSVEALDDYTARTAPVKDLRKSFIAERKDVTDFWKQFIGYCITAYADDVVNRDAMLGEAGQTYYDKVSNGSWKEVEGLLSALVPFVQNHKDELMQKGFMPASFVTRLEEKQTSFNAAHQTWKSEDKATSPATEAKIIACNDLKDKAAQALSDAQKALIKDKENAQKFVWATILDQVRGEKPTGLGGKVTIQDGKKGIGTATVSIPSLGLTVTCDKDGRYEFPTLTEGVYTLEFKAEGYHTLVVADREVKAGVKGRLNVELEPMMAMAMA